MIAVSDESESGRPVCEGHARIFWCPSRRTGGPPLAERLHATLLADDAHARTIAGERRIPVVRTLGVLVSATIELVELPRGFKVLAARVGAVAYSVRQKTRAASGRLAGWHPRSAGPPIESGYYRSILARVERRWQIGHHRIDQDLPMVFPTEGG
jgi:hypothetical protein